MRLAAFLFVLAVSPVVRAADVQSFLSDYCLDCHDHRTKKGGFSMEELGAVTAPECSPQWLKILEQLERRNMPPVDEDQPPAEVRRSTMLALEDGLVSGARSRAEHRPAVLRRLTRVEYRNTLRDLLSLNENSTDPTREFPDDTRSHGFQSNGGKLVTSNFLLRHYVEAADQTIAEAIHFEPKPETKHWEMLPPFDRTRTGFVSPEANYYRKIAKQPQPYQTITERMVGMPMSGFHPLDELRDQVAVSGWYSIRIQAEAKYHDVDIDPKDPALDLRQHKFPSLWDPVEPIRLSLSTATLAGVNPSNQEARDYAATHHQAGQRDLAVWDLPHDQQTWVECRVWLNQGELPRLGFPNGPTDSNNRVSNFFRANKERLLTKEQLENYEKDRLVSGDNNVWMWFESPRILVISEVEITGPLNDVWPPASHRVVFGDVSYRSAAAAEVLQKFATRAWRRPARDEEVAPIVNLVRASEKHGLSAESAIQEGLKAILCSPEFIYREEKGGELSDYELASRLSYFLTSSMPDERLLQRAAAGELKRPEVLREEALRLLQNSGSNAFTEAMMSGWLAMYKLGSMAPDVRKFAFYYDDHLEPAMKMETRLFFQQMLRTNAPIDRFLSCDYTFVNRQLAKLYGIDAKIYEEALGKDVEGLGTHDLVPDADGHAPSIGFAKVKLTDPRRGGLLGQASVLTLSANGVDTSPVIRGVWILDNILGAPPSPPPPNVPTIEPDARGTKTIRDRLEKHRASATCYACHHQIDPPGFALEEFDAVGRLRTSYVDGNNRLPLDSGGQFGAAKFTDVSGFKSALLDHREQFARCLVEKFLIHALGRDLEITDRPAIRQIVETTAKDNYRLQDLVLLCVQSEIFRTK